MYLHVLQFRNSFKWHTKLKSFFVIINPVFISHFPYYSCWWPGDTRNQNISSHSIDIPYCPHIRRTRRYDIIEGASIPCHYPALCGRSWCVTAIWLFINFGDQLSPTAVSSPSQRKGWRDCHCDHGQHMPCLNNVLVYGFRKVLIRSSRR